LYFTDGYHGGAKGHMPAGAWRDILDAMREIPHWKLCLDIEPESWDALLRDDPAAYHELKNYLERAEEIPRIEMVGATFSQPYGWAVNGESNIRQLTRGMEIIRRHFPRTAWRPTPFRNPAAPVACPKSCARWASAMPCSKIRAPHGEATRRGWMPKWSIGPVRMGPPFLRFRVTLREETRKVYETESGNPTPEFARKCVAHGIRHPAGTYLQDLGWVAKPRAADDYIRNVTWREYFRHVADPPAKDWKFSIEDILTTLPWGEKTLQAVAQQERAAENRILLAEKMAAIAWMEKRMAWPAAERVAAWDDLLWAQGHDPWITATTRTGRQAWAFQVGAGTLRTEDTANAIIRNASIALSAGTFAPGGQHLGAQWLRVVNTLGSARDELVEFNLATDRGTPAIRVFDSQNRELPCQITPVRRYSSQQTSRNGGRGASLAPGESLNAATILFPANVPAVGSSTFRVEPVYDDPARVVSSATPASASRSEDGAVLLENDFYQVHIDPARGGAITGLPSFRICRSSWRSTKPWTGSRN